MPKKTKEVKTEFFSTVESPEAKELREERQKMHLMSKLVNTKKNKSVIITMKNCEIVINEVDSDGTSKEKVREQARWDVCLWIYCRWQRRYYAKGYYEEEHVEMDMPKKRRRKKEVNDD